jgi:hypothetical protein
MKNRTRESCTSGSVRDEDGNILIYSARPPVYVASPCAAGIRNPSQKRLHELLAGQGPQASRVGGHGHRLAGRGLHPERAGCG